MFRGINSIKLDVKGRIAIPTRYRAKLEQEASSNIVVTIDTEEQCLLLYPLHTWEDIEKKLTVLPSFNSASRRIQRLLMGHATDITLDEHGRLLLPLALRDYAKLDKKAVLIGQGTKFELWDELHWQERRDVWLEDESGGDDGADLPDSITSLSL